MKSSELEQMPKKSEISWDYQQPDFYKFSEDSIYLSKYAIGKIKGNINILDVGSGCGVIGLEIIQGSSFSPHVDFLEIQPEFRPYFEANKKYLNATHANFIQGDYSKTILNKKYDLIVSNPPYFPINENRLGECYKKNTCRFFLNGDLDNLLSFFKKHLTKEGMGLFLCRKGQVATNKFKIISKDNKTDLVQVLSLDI